MTVTFIRVQNPTNDMVAAKIADLEGGVAALLTSSGQAANFYATLNLCEAGDHLISTSTIYGGTFNLFAVTFKNWASNVLSSTQMPALKKLKKRSVLTLSWSSARQLPIPL